MGTFFRGTEAAPTFGTQKTAYLALNQEEPMPRSTLSGTIN